MAHPALDHIAALVSDDALLTHEVMGCVQSETMNRPFCFIGQSIYARSVL